MSLLYDPHQHGRIDFVLHPTDLSEASERAFHHALAIAIRQGAQFTLLHALGRRATDNWVDFPSVRGKLAEWRSAGTLESLEEKARRASVSKIEVDIRDPVAASLQYIERNAVDLVVLATQDRSGLSRLVRASGAERLARGARVYTLFIPAGGRYFVDAGSGAVGLRHILVPVDPQTDPRPAMLRAVSIAALMNDPTLEITLLHVGESESMSTEVPDLPFCRWRVVQRPGDPTTEILAQAEELPADVICMSTHWSRVRFGRTENTVTERVIGAALCPVATVPVS
ncbi:MAG: universal stress protein [Gemmatimonadota bacterium]|nr:universal stress protein [Gemmatimonadota bacterium]